MLKESISIKEAKDKKYQLQNDIESLIQKFNEETGSVVTEITIENDNSFCGVDQLIGVNVKAVL